MLRAVVRGRTQGERGRKRKRSMDGMKRRRTYAEMKKEIPKNGRNVGLQWIVIPFHSFSHYR
jgi:hypothetical protein